VLKAPWHAPICRQAFPVSAARRMPVAAQAPCFVLLRVSYSFAPSLLIFARCESIGTLLIY
jgi:hypothetical protein